jgi:hypothetical protein
LWGGFEVSTLSTIDDINIIAKKQEACVMMCVVSYGTPERLFPGECIMYLAHTAMLHSTLWTVGTTIHCMFDLSVCFIAACGCCQAGGSLECLGGFRWLGSYIVLFAVVVTAATASFIVVLRATLDDHPEIDTENITSAGLFDDAIALGSTDSADSYRFLISWCIEMVLALFVYYFLVGTIFFSGILGCYTLPFLGGRPREVALEEKERLKRNPTASDTYEDEESPRQRPSSRRR